MLTRQKIANMKSNSLKCKSCNEFWGLRENMYLCSKCIKNAKKYEIPKVPKIGNKYIHKLPDEQFNYIYSSFKFLYKWQDGDTISNLIMDRLQSIQSFSDDETHEKLYLLSDEQSIKLINLINWKIRENGAKISHAITRWRLNPWCMKNDCHNIFHKSSFCYWGNMGEKPPSEEQLINLYNRNTSTIKIF